MSKVFPYLKHKYLDEIKARYAAEVIYNKTKQEKSPTATHLLVYRYNWEAEVAQHTLYDMSEAAAKRYYEDWPGDSTPLEIYVIDPRRAEEQFREPRCINYA